MSFAKEAKSKCEQNKTKRKSRLSLMLTSSKSLISEIRYDNNKFVRAYEIRIKYSITQLVTVHIGIQSWQNVAILSFFYRFWIIYGDVDLSLYRSLSFILHCSIYGILYYSVYVLNGVQGVSYRIHVILISCVCVCVTNSKRDKQLWNIHQVIFHDFPCRMIQELEGIVYIFDTYCVFYPNPWSADNAQSWKQNVLLYSVRSLLLFLVPFLNFIFALVLFCLVENVI